MKPKTKSNKKELCLECLGAKDIYDGTDYIKCSTCKGKGLTTEAENIIFLSSLQVEEDSSI